MKLKSDAIVMFKQFLHLTERQFGHRVKVLQADKRIGE